MEKGKAALAALAALCIITVGAGGLYLGTRSSGSAPPADVASLSTDPALLQTVEASEAIVSDDAPVPAQTVPAAPPTIERPMASVRPAPPSQRDAGRSAEAPRVAVEPAQHQAPAPRAEAESVPLPVREPAPTRTIEPEPERVSEPPAPQFVDLVVPSDAVLGLQVETSLTSERARVEDEVIARVTRDVRVSDRVAIPAGARAEGEVTLVERGGRMRERARLGIRFTSVVLADGTRIPLETEAIYREGDSPGGESAAKIGGGAIGGAIIGGILGGARGAVIGGSVGAGAGSAAVLAGGRNPATLPTGTPVTVRLVSPTTVTVEK